MVKGDLLRMGESKGYQVSQTAGDAAVDGLFSGVKAGLLVLLVLGIADWVAGFGTIRALAALFDQNGLTILTVVLVHLAISGVYGVIFALACHGITGKWLQFPPAWATALVGIAYGTVVYLIASATLLRELEALPEAALFILYWLFGVALAFFSRSSRLNFRRYG